jgi:hypothetical protein
MEEVTGPLQKAVLFTTALMVAAGKFADMTSFEQLMAALKPLVGDIESQGPARSRSLSENSSDST